MMAGQEPGPSWKPDGTSQPGVGKAGDQVPKSWRRLTAGWGRRGAVEGTRESACPAEKATRTYCLRPASCRPPTSGLPGGLPPPRRCRPGGAVAAGTASDHQLPLRPRAPPLGGNGQRACARTRLRFLPRGGVWGGFEACSPSPGNP